MSGAAEELGIGEFLEHSNRSDTGLAWLDKWKDRKPPVVRVLLHTKAKIVANWSHPWPRIQTVEKDGREERQVWSSKFNSWDSAAILKKQYHRDRDTDERVMMPEDCPMGLILEQIEDAMRAGELNWATPLFRFEGDDKSKIKTLYAASMCGRIKSLFKGKIPWASPDAEERRVARSDGFPGEDKAWQGTMMAKCRYILTIVDYNKPESGPQIADETSAIGDGMKSTIRSRMKGEGDEEGNPLITPYVFEWTHDPDAKSFSDTYKVDAIGNKVAPLSDEHRSMIGIGEDSKDNPDISGLIKRGDVEKLRASMEDSYCGPSDLLDFDAAFLRAETELGIEDEGEDDEPDSSRTPEVGADIPTDEEAVEAEEKRQAEEAAPDREIDRQDDDGRCFAADGVEVFKCEDCQIMLREDEAVCYKCGADYGEEEPEPEPEPEPPPKPKPEPPTRTRKKPQAKKEPAKKAPAKDAPKKSAAKKTTKKADTGTKKKGKKKVPF